MLWMCYGNDIYCVRAGIADPSDTTAAAAPISTFAVSQTCAMEPESPTGTAVTGDLPVRGSTVAVTEDSTPTGPATTKGDAIWPNTTSPYGPAVTGGTTHDGGNAATTALPGNPDMTGGGTQDGGAVPTPTSNPAAPAQHTTPPAEDPVPTNESATLGNGSATSPTGMVTSIRSVDHEAPTCTCHAG
ncbi:hypothetical protein E5D57_013308 [Metarhizium anisopliae]|nr:hypothetical protein E5D57_013308 [Metarhizium anisopliae]